MIQILHNSRCSKSRAAVNYLDEQNIAHEVIQYLKTPLTKEGLTDVLKKLNIAPHDLIRKNEAIYKEEYKGKALSDDEWIDAMLTHPKLIERPIVIKGDKAVIGRPLENIIELVG